MSDMFTHSLLNWRRWRLLKGHIWEFHGNVLYVMNVWHVYPPVIEMKVPASTQGTHMGVSWQCTQDKVKLTGYMMHYTTMEGKQ